MGRIKPTAYRGAPLSFMSPPHTHKYKQLVQCLMVISVTELPVEILELLQMD